MFNYYPVEKINFNEKELKDWKTHTNSIGESRSKICTIAYHHGASLDEEESESAWTLSFRIFDLARIQETIEPTNKPTSQPVVNPPAVVGTGPRNSITAKLLDWRRVSSIHTTVSTLFRRSNREETSLCVLYICDPSPSFIGKWETNSSVSVTRITEI